MTTTPHAHCGQPGPLSEARQLPPSGAALGPIWGMVYPARALPGPCPQPAPNLQLESGPPQSPQVSERMAALVPGVLQHPGGWRRPQCPRHGDGKFSPRSRERTTDNTKHGERDLDPEGPAAQRAVAWAMLPSAGQRRKCRRSVGRARREFTEQVAWAWNLRPLLLVLQQCGKAV